MKLERHQSGFFIDNEFILNADRPETRTIQPDGIEPNAKGEYYIHKGQMIDAEGKVVTLSSSGEDLTFSTPPIGIITETKNMTNHETNEAVPTAVSVMRRGLIQAKFLPYPEGVEYSESFDSYIEEALPHILCYGNNGSSTKKLKAATNVKTS